MNREPVKSSNILSIGHDPETDVLEVEFKSGSIYQYTGVPARVHQNLIGSDSIGGHLHRNVVGTYPHKRVG